eukprot:scaffold163264_cov19-Tisochrysis_lutea.AAC.2
MGALAAAVCYHVPAEHHCMQLLLSTTTLLQGIILLSATMFPQGNTACNRPGAYASGGSVKIMQGLVGMEGTCAAAIHHHAAGQLCMRHSRKGGLCFCRPPLRCCRASMPGVRACDGALSKPFSPFGYEAAQPRLVKVLECWLRGSPASAHQGAGAADGTPDHGGAPRVPVLRHPNSLAAGQSGSEERI